MQDATITWIEQDIERSALWRSERGVSPPKRAQIADDTLSADSAYKLATEGVGLLWRGDFQNAKHLIQALERRLEKRADRPPKRLPKRSAAQDDTQQPNATASAADKASETASAFYRHRQTQAQRARVLGMVLLPVDADCSIPLRRAPDVKLACEEAWGEASAQEKASNTHSVAASATHSVVSLRELLGIISAHEWRKRGVEVPALGFNKKGLLQRIHAHYGVFSPVRGEYLELVHDAPLPTSKKPEQLLAFDIGTGTGVLAAILAQRDIGKIIATDLDPRALACAQDNFKRLSLNAPKVQLEQVNLFPNATLHGKADLIVCNPPWMPGKPSSALERAVYDEGSSMLKGYLQGLSAHLAPSGESWLILSDLAEHLGLRPKDELQKLIQAAGLKVIGQLSTSPNHPKANDVTDPFFAARSREKTHLWRLSVA